MIPSFQRAVTFIKNCGDRGLSVQLKADGSTPAHLNPSADGWDEEWLVSYLKQEVRMSNFTDAVRKKGYGSIFLVGPSAESVLHIRVVQHDLDVFHYLD